MINKNDFFKIHTLTKYFDNDQFMKIIDLYNQHNVEHDKIEIFFENDDDEYMIVFYKNEKIVDYVIFNFDVDILTIDNYDCETIEQCINEFFN